MTQRRIPPPTGPPMSFKRKLVLYFVVLTLLPLTAAFVTFQPALERSEEHILDERLKTALRSSAVGYEDEVRAVERRALRLAGAAAFQRALAARDRTALDRMLDGSSGLRVEAGTLRVGAGAGP